MKWIAVVSLASCTGSGSDKDTSPRDTSSPDPDTDGDADTDADSDADADTDADADSDADADADSDADTDPTTGDTGDDPLPGGPGVGAVLVDASGAPIASALVLGCTATYCLSTSSAADGWFWFGTGADALIALKVQEDVTSSPRRAWALEPVQVPGTDAVDAGELFAPDLPAGEPWGPIGADPQTFDAGDGLVLTMNRADLTLAIFGVFDDVAAAAIPAEYVPTYPGLTDPVEAVYAVHPFEAHSTSPIAVQAPTALASGTVVHFHSIDPLGGGLSAPATGVSDGAFVTTDAGQGLFELSYVVITVP